MNEKSHPNLLKAYRANMAKARDICNNLSEEVDRCSKILNYPFDDFGLRLSSGVIRNYSQELETIVTKLRTLSEAHYAIEAPIESVRQK